MKPKVDEQMLISYLYGELVEKEKKFVEDYLKENPEKASELEAMGDTRSILAKVEDNEIDVPELIFTNRKSSFWYSNSFKAIASVAAALLLLIVSGYLLGLNISVRDNQLTIAYGKISADKSEYISADEVRAIVDKQLNSMNQNVEAKLTATVEEIDNKLKQSDSDSRALISSMMKKKVLVSQAEIDQYVSQLNEESKKEIAEFFSVNTLQQQVYIQNVLTDFSTYMDQQRTEDMNKINDYITNLDSKTTQKQTQTDQILASIISQVNYTQGE